MIQPYQKTDSMLNPCVHMRVSRPLKGTAHGRPPAGLTPSTQRARLEGGQKRKRGNVAGLFIFKTRAQDP